MSSSKLAIWSSKTKSVLLLFESTVGKNTHRAKLRTVIVPVNRSSIRWQSTQTDGGHQKAGGSLLTTSLKYLISIGLGSAIGIATGYWLMLDQYKSDNQNEHTRDSGYQPTKYIQHRGSPYSDFPLTFHLYQYASCPYCSQLRAYLDYFGFDYHVTEVDSYSKEELVKFTRARQLPILIIEDKLNSSKSGQKFHLTNATAILSALESLRNDKHINFNSILNQYLPVLKGKSVFSTTNQFKYHVTNSDLNSVEWRKWVNNVAVPALKLNSISNLKDLFETFDYYAKKSDWKSRYGPIKYMYVYYSNAFHTYTSYSSLLSQLSSTTSSSKPREILNEVISKWEDGLSDGQNFISGMDQPNLADIMMYGAMRAYEGCALYRESIGKHRKFKEWYERMKLEVVNGHNQRNLKLLPPLKSVKGEQLSKILANSSSSSSKAPQVVAKSLTEVNSIRAAGRIETTTTSPTIQTSYHDASAQTVPLPVSPPPPPAPKLEDVEVTLFRVVTATYLIHVVAFTLAAYYK